MSLKVIKFPLISMLEGIEIETSYFYIEHLIEQVILSANQGHEIDTQIYQQLDVIGAYLLGLIDDEIATEFESDLFKKIYEAVCTNKQLVVELGELSQGVIPMTSGSL
jgi:hypothetical protein